MADVTSIRAPFEIFTGTDGEPLGAGYVYIGTANQDPVTNPVALFWDAAMTVPASQPIRTLAGFISRGGTPAAVYAGVLTYSILVQNKKGQLIFSVPSADGGVVNIQNIRTDLAASGAGQGASMLGYLSPLTGAVATTQQQVNNEEVSFFRFLTPAQIAAVQAGTLAAGAVCDAALVAAGAVANDLYFPSGKYRFDSAKSFTGFRGVRWRGAGASLTTTGASVATNTVFSFDSAPPGTVGLTVSSFAGFTMKDIYISQNRAAAGGGTALYLNSGHDFLLENIKVDDNTGSAGAGIKLGGALATSVFAGKLQNCKVISHGKSFWSGKANTSLTFESCYQIGGTYYIDGTVYSSFISCASDSSAADHGFHITGDSSFNSSNLAFIGCGAESNYFAAFGIDSYSNCLTFISPYGAANNQAGLTTVGDLFYVDSSTGSVKGISITAPSAFLPTVNTFANISVSYNAGSPTLSTGNIAVHGYNAAVMTKGIKAQTTPFTVAWASEFLTVFGDTQGVARLEAYSQFKPMRIYSQGSGGGLYTSFTEELITLTAANLLDTILGQGNPDLVIFAKNRILGWSFRVDTLLASSDGGTTFSIIAQAGFAAPVTLVSGLTFTKNTKWTTMSAGLSTDQLTTGTVILRIQCDGGKTFSAGGQVRVIVYRERVIDMDNAI